METEKVTSKGFRTTKTIKLPSGVSIELYSSLLIKDIQNVGDITKAENAFEMMVKLIKSWNFYNHEDDNDPLSIDLKNLSLLPVGDITFITEEIKKFSQEQKKN